MFSEDKFLNTRFKMREKSIKVPELKHQFGDDDPVWVVRQLSAYEIAECNAEVQKNMNLSEWIRKSFSGTTDDKIEIVNEIFGLVGDKAPEDIVRRLVALRIGSVSPKITHQGSLKLAAYFSTQFYDLTNHIFVLTGLGAELGE